ncbi:MAG: energy-coupling factor ABC transporter ATP-binding protein [Clostridiales Family XIII bacterium]|jgi:energy-coupling factor transport system ATP-binding protein|nr:energy-coupling factor ABC transporter ATP-binding protein [Clostridiales Family XIII bacterium]
MSSCPNNGFSDGVGAGAIDAGSGSSGGCRDNVGAGGGGADAVDGAGLSLAKVAFSYHMDGEQPALSGFSVSFAPRELTVVTGASGCGKSTMLYLAAGIYPKYAGSLTSGTVRLGGEDVAGIPPERRAALIGMMFQNPDLQFCMDTAESELIFCLENISIERGEIDARVEDALEFCGIGHLRRRRLDTLSGGEKQKVALACLVALDSQWLLLDEPFANIDAASASELASRLGRLVRERGKSVIAVDHKLDVWIGADEQRPCVANSITVFGKGGIMKTGIRPHSAEMNGLPAQGVDIPAERYRPPDAPAGTVAAHMPTAPAPTFVIAGSDPQSTRDVAAAPAHTAASTTPAPARETFHRLDDVGVDAGGVPVLSGLCASMGAGRIHAVLGASGSGKSTLLEAICGFRPYRGSIRAAGGEVSRIPKRQLCRTVGFVFQNPQDQFVASTVLGEVLTGMKARGGFAGEAACLAEAERVLRGAGLWRYRMLSPYMLSQGEQRRLALAALLVYRCPLLVCDEPTYAQDLFSLRSVMGMLSELVENDGLTLLMSTHDEKLARDYAHHIWRLDGGMLCED